MAKLATDEQQLVQLRRRRVLRIHGSLLLILGLGNAALSTIGWQSGLGPMGFLQDGRLGHVGLIQAYLLAALFGFVLIKGARQPGPLTWNAVGIAVHVAILSAYAFHWDYFGQIPGGDILRYGLFMHLAFIGLEAWAIVWGSNRRRPSVQRAGA